MCRGWWVVAALWWVAAAGPGPPVDLRVPELAAPGTPALPPPGVSPLWRPRPPQHNLQYRLRHGDRTFRADSRCLGDRCFLTLRVRAAHDLNRERKDVYRLTVRAVTTGADGAVTHEEDIPIRVQVTDVNDLSPLFYPTEYETSLREDTPLHATITTVTAEDADLGLNGEIYYSLEGEDDQFAVHPTSGAVTLTRPLSHITHSTHILHVLAQDRAALLDRGDKAPAARANVTVHVLPANLHAPSIRVSTASTLHPPSDVAIVALLHVTDSDEEVHGIIDSVEIVDGDPDGHFRIVALEPGLYQVVAHELTRGPATYNLTVRAADGGSPRRESYAPVAVSVSASGDVGPVFARELYEAHVSETAPPGTPLVRLKVAAPLPGVFLEIVGGNEGGEFRIEPEGGVLYTAVWLDAEKKSQYTLTVSAIDHADLGPRRQSSAKVLITVLDANDNDPVFDETDIEVTVKENGHPGEVVAKMIARDADSGENAYISYSIANLQPVPFEIEHFSGVIRTTHQLDYETMRREYTLYVRAGDWGLPYRRQSETTVKVRLIDVNDNRPQFERVDCVGYLAKKTTTGTEVFTFSAIDFDAGDVVSYRLVSGNDDNCFTLDSNTGVISVVCDLSDIQTETRVLNVTATDGTHFADPTSITLHLTDRTGTDRSGPELECRETAAARRLTDVLAAAARANAPQDPTDEFHLAPSRYGLNLHTPEFIDFPVEVKVNESVKLGTTLVKLKAQDRDLGFNGLLIFVISNGDDDSAFRVDPETGELQVIGYLDRERETEYYLNVTVYDQGRPRRSTSRLLPITVLDVNDNVPKFEKNLASYRVTENAINGTVIYRANATDPDGGDFGQVTYSVSGAEHGEFCIDRYSGTLSVCAPLDRERRALYELIVRATDGGGLSSVAAVRVSVDDVNDNAPKFSQHSYTVRVPEDYPRGALVAVVEARDPDTGPGGTVRYSLADLADDQMFSVDAISGALRLRGRLDYEVRRAYGVTVRATDGGTPALWTDVAVLIEVQDVDENRYAPEFPTAPAASLKVSEAMGPGALVGEVKARDADGTGRDARLTYSLVNGTGLPHFSVDDSAALRTLTPLDAETAPHYWLTLCAQDHAVISKYSCIEVYIEVEDVNDVFPWPTMASYIGEVTENCGAGVVVGTVTAHDDDLHPAPLTYRLVAGNPDGLFTIDQHTGVVRTTGRAVDREAAGFHALEVQVSDGGLTATARLHVSVADMNDHTPVFTRRHYRLHPPATVALNAVDAEPEPDLDADADSDEGDAESEGPEAPDHSSNGLYIGRVVALDLDSGVNGTVRYGARGGRGRVSVHPHTGKLYLADNAPADRHYRLTVSACDGGAPPRCGWSRVWVSPRAPAPPPALAPPPLTLDPPPLTLDPPPLTLAPPPLTLAPPPPLQVAELDPPGFLVALLQARHPNNESLSYDIVDGDPRQEFYIGHDDGSLIVAKRLLWERQREYTLNVSVSDGRSTIYTPVSISVVNDLNEQGVKFTQTLYEFEVSEDIGIGEVIGKLVANGAPGVRILYGIHGVKDNATLGRFRVDELTGEVSVAKGLDAELAEVHHLTVWARDSAPRASRAFSRLRITVKDCDDLPPVWGRRLAELRLSRDLPTGALAATLHAADPDRLHPELRYTLEDSEHAAYFAIDPRLGALTLLKPLPALPELTLQVRATAGERWSSLAVRVTIVEPERAPPTFPTSMIEARISEAAQPGTPIVTLEARSASSVWYTLEGGDGLFAINPLLGTITVAARLNFEQAPRHRLQVTAWSPSGGSAQMVVEVAVLDANEYPPLLTKSWYRGRITESQLPGDLVWEDSAHRPLLFNTTDDDSPENQLRNYHILDPEAANVFKINPVTGALSILKPLDYEAQSVYNFTIKVVDGGSPPIWARSEAKVTIYVTDEDDEPPVIVPPSPAVVTVPTATDVVITTLTAKDPDTASNLLRYRIVNGNEAGAYSLDAKTGALKVAASELVVDGELEIAVLDPAGHEGHARLEISIKSLAAAGLTFPRDRISVSALENSPRIVTLAHLHVLGAALHDTLTFHILNPTPYFTIGITSGVIRTTEIPLDREEKDSYSLLIEAKSNGAGEQRVCRTVVEISVTDVNDHCPQWTHQPYSGVVSAGDPPGTLVAVVSATDKDAADNGEVRYELVRGHGELFRMDRATGRLTLKRSPDAGHDIYQLTVAAFDGGTPPCGTEAAVTVRVYGGGAAPSWERALYHINVPYNLKLPVSLNPPLAARSPLQRQLIYSIVDPERHANLDIQFETGALIAVSRGVGLEEVAVTALDAVGGAVAETRVLVTWEPRPPRPHWPLNPSLLSANVAETATPGTVLIRLPHAINRTDLQGKLTYKVEEAETGKEAVQFTIKESSEGVRVELQRALDADVRSTHLLRLIAFVTVDNYTAVAHKLLLVTVENVNDSPPELVGGAGGSVWGLVSGEASRGTVAAAVRARDPDGDTVRYRPVPPWGHSYRLHPTTGLISLATPDPGPADLVVAVDDGAHVLMVPVHITAAPANLHSPHFPHLLYEVRVAHNATPPVYLTTVKAEDPDPGDYGKITYSMEPSELFTIDSRTGTVRAVSGLAGRGRTEWEVGVWATDGGGRRGRGAVRVRTDVVRAPRPALDRLRACGAPGGRLGTVARPGITHYKLKGAIADMNQVRLDSSTGELFLRENTTLSENQCISVWARLPPAETSVHTCRGPPPPLAPLPPAVFLPETAPAGTLLASLDVRPRPDRPVTYSLLAAPSKDYFSIDKDGKLYLVAPLDRERDATHAIGVIAEWGDVPAGGCARQEQTELHVLDVNDNAPVFTAKVYSLELAENTPPQSIVYSVKAVDLDAGNNGEVRYTLEGESDEGTFSIDAVSGAIRTEKPLDRETTSQYKIGLIARDAGGLEAKATLLVLILDYPDEPPLLATPPAVSLPEDAPPGTLVIRLQVEDKDETFPPRRYLVIDGDPDGQFDMREDGALLVVRQLDREVTPRYLLTLLVTDGRFSRNTSLEIRVLDVNDNRPYCLNDEYEVEVSEDVEIGTYLTKMEWSDLDEPQNSAVRYSLQGEGAALVRIEPQSGVIRTAGVLDREKTDSYDLTITVRDVDHPDWTCSSRLKLRLLDVNDNTPTFSSSLYPATLPEDAEPGTPVASMHATDADSGRNRLLRYRLLDTEDASQFSLDTSTGVVSLRAPLDRETRAELRAIVEARDLGDPPRSATATLLLTVADVNDNPPEFTYHQYAAAVPEIDAPGSQVLRVEAVSRDTGPNAQVHYELLDGEGREDFNVDRLTGVVSVMRPLDFERRQGYLLSIRAEDEGEPPLSDVAVLNITVTDVNDNEPVFEQSSYGARVREDARPGTEITVVRAVDADSGVFGEVKYSIERGDGWQFAIDPDTGRVTLVAALDRELTPAHVLEIAATDGGAPALRTLVSLSLEVLDVNDCPPQFARPNYTAVLREDRPLDHPLLRLDVSDRDAPPNGPPFTFDFRFGNQMGEFRLDQDGYLRTATRFNHRIKDHYLLQVRVFDNGNPPLFADTWVRVDVVEQSRFPPVLSPLAATLVWRGVWPGGEVAELRARDSDPDDQLTYTAPPHPVLSVDSATGTLLLTRAAAPGEYLYNVTVSDGRFSTSAVVRLSYVEVSDALLDSALVVRFRAVSPPTFVERHRRGFLRAVSEAVGVPLEDVVLLAVQPSGETGARKRRDVPRDLDVLFVVRGVAPAEVRRRLHAHLAPLEERTRLVVEELVRAACTAGCVRGTCRERVRVEGAVRSVGGEVAALAAPGFAVEARCECDVGWAGPRCQRGECVGCQRGECVGGAGPRCQRGECVRCGAAVRLWGRGAVAARVAGGAVLGARPLVDELVVALRVRTWRSSGTLVWASGPVDLVALQLVDGAVVARLELGAGEVSVRAGHVADGAWHDVVLERRGASLRVSVDRHSAHAVAPPAALILDTSNPVVYFGAVVMDDDPKISYGLVGCLSDLTLGGEPVVLTVAENGTVSGGRGAGAGVVETGVVGGGVEGGCGLTGTDECTGLDCGPGLCTVRDGVARCDCGPRWAGAHCHVPISPCAAKPCLHGGTCHPRSDPPGYLCECPAGLSGVRCQSGRYCSEEACLHGGACEEGVSGPSCSCRGYFGPRCELDVDECAGEPCLNGATCVNEPGSFRCVCPPDHTGAHCGNPLHSNAVTAGAESTLRALWVRLSGLGWRWLVAAVAALGAFLALCLVGVALCRRRPRPAPALRQNNVPAPPPKLSNLEASLRPRSCAPDAPSPPPLNNMDTLRSYGSAGDELEALPQHYIRNLNLDPHLVKPWSEQMHLHTFTDNKIHNDLKASKEPEPCEVRSVSRDRHRGGAIVGGYHWDVSDWAGPGGDWADSTGDWGSGLDSSDTRHDSDPEEIDPLLDPPPRIDQHPAETASLITMMEVGAPPDHAVCDIDTDSDSEGHTAV